MHFEQYALRLLQHSDLHPYYNMVERNRERLANFFTGTVSRTSTLEDTKAFVEDMQARVEQKSYFPYLLINTDAEAIIGFFDVKNIDWNIPKAELGCYIDDAYANKGITTKAFNLFVTHCFQTYAFKKLFLRTHHSNIAAVRVAERCGFKLEGTIRRDYKTTAGELVDLLYYGKLPEEHV